VAATRCHHFGLDAGRVDRPRVSAIETLLGAGLVNVAELAQGCERLVTLGEQLLQILNIGGLVVQTRVPDKSRVVLGTYHLQWYYLVTCHIIELIIII